MAERRMFAKTIIDSDAFLDMPLSAQTLYFHLSMRGDDEGFVNNPKKIQRMIGASEDDLKLLVAKSFIIPFDSGIVVIKHWMIHNYIRADRVVKTKYQKEKSQLVLKENGAYSLQCDAETAPALEDAEDKRKHAYRVSSLPYSFTYKMRRAFDGETCPICGCTMSSSYRQTTPTVQHNLPISKGGEHELDNISMICLHCNTQVQENETGPLNNAQVIEIWDRIIEAENRGIEWFYNREILFDESVFGKCQASDGQVTDICQTNGRIGKDRLGKDRLGKDRLGKVRVGKDRLGEVIGSPSVEEIPQEEVIPAVCSKPSEAFEPEADTCLIPLNDGSGWRPKINDFTEWQKVYPNVDISKEMERMRQWCLSNPTKRKTRKGVRRFVTSWLDREQNRSGQRPGGKGQGMTTEEVVAFLDNGGSFFT